MEILSFHEPQQEAGNMGVAGDEGDQLILSECRFRHQLSNERRRCERSQRSLLLLLLEDNPFQPASKPGIGTSQLGSLLSPVIRSTDFLGWYRTHATLGVIFTELPSQDRQTVLDAVLQRLGTLLRKNAPDAHLQHLTFSFHFYPDSWGEDSSEGGLYDTALYPDTVALKHKRRVALGTKRAFDVLFSSLLLVLSSPLFFIIAAAVKFTSHGPVFFIQQRVGQYGRQFTFLKFRSMHANSDCAPHRNFVKSFIAGNQNPKDTCIAAGVIYKLADDDRITPLGKFLRRTSLDELPQLINVVLGQMSLVGPRPPLPYELAAYQTWHRNRLLNVKPGMTGLWQVKGRSHVRFDDMVRMDLRYAEKWSLWLDLRILAETPAVILRGAY